MASPIDLLPFPTPLVCIHGRTDAHVPLEQSAAFADAAPSAGSDARLHLVDGDDFEAIDPEHETWRWARGSVLELDQPGGYGESRRSRARWTALRAAALVADVVFPGGGSLSL